MPPCLGVLEVTKPCRVFVSFNLLVNGFERAGEGGFSSSFALQGPLSAGQAGGEGCQTWGSSKDKTPDLVWITSGVCRMGSAERGLAQVS